MEHPENDDQYKGLKVNKGIADVPTVNPYIKKRAQRKVYTPSEFVEGILKGNITILSQAVTLVESSKHEHQQVAQEIIEKCLPFAGKSVRIGITGVPGAGKSTSIDSFGMHLINQGRKLAVLAIDPSSERSKGSILGDKTRMEALGVGQSETAVHSMVDFFLLIQLAGTGDELQGIKRGIMEMADGIIINKADGDNIDKANLAAAQFRNALHLFPPSESGWFPKVLTYSGYYNIGIKEIWDMVGEYMEFTKKNGYFNYKRNEQAKYWMYESINDTLRDKFYHNPAVEGMLEQTEKQVLNNEISSFVAAKRMIDLFLDHIATK